VRKRERRVLLAKFAPEIGGPVSTGGVHVMEDDHAVWREFGEPCREVVLHRFVRVEAVDVQQVNRAVGKFAQSVVEQAAMQPNGQSVVMAVDHRPDALDDFLAVEPGVLLALPSVDRVQSGGQAAVLDGLAEREEGHPIMGAQFDYDVRLTIPNEVIGKTAVARPWTCATFGVRGVRLELRRAQDPIVREVVPHVRTPTGRQYQRWVAAGGIGLACRRRPRTVTLSTWRARTIEPKVVPRTT
jgi:hypothetical protein